MVERIRTLESSEQHQAEKLGFRKYLRSYGNGLLTGESFMTAAQGSENEQNGGPIDLLFRRPDDFHRSSRRVVAGIQAP